MSTLPKLTDYLSLAEGPELEFKSRRALEDPRIIPRAVCAFLNSQGGEIVIGICETEKGLAVEPVEEPEKAQRAVLDRILSSVEPAPSGLVVDVLPSAAGPGLRIRVPRGSGVHVLKERQGAFAAFQRIGDRLVPLPWLEIQRRLSVAKFDVDATKEQGLLDSLEAWREKTMKDSEQLSRDGGLLLLLRRVPHITLPDDRAPIVSWIEDPTLLGIRRMGWHYSTRGPVRPVQGERGWFRAGEPQSGFRRLELSVEGEMRFATRLGNDLTRPPPWEVDPSRRNALYPYALCETVVSCVVLFARLLDLAPGRGQVESALGLQGIRGLRLGPYRPGIWGYELPDHWSPPYPAAEIRPAVGVADEEDLRKNPHRLAWLLLRQVYQDFGYEEKDVPFYDREKEKFVFE